MNWVMLPAIILKFWRHSLKQNCELYPIMNWFSFSFLWSLHIILFWQPHCQQHQYAEALNSIITINKTSLQISIPISPWWSAPSSYMNIACHSWTLEGCWRWFMGLSDDHHHLCHFADRPISSYNRLGRNCIPGAWHFLSGSEETDYIHNDNHYIKYDI